jgi:von Willebrand factor type D domain
MESLLSPARGLGAKALGSIVVASVLPLLASLTAYSQPIPPSQTAQAPEALSQEELQKREEWRKALLATPRPKNGCFTGVYPERTWREVPCAPPKPTKLYLPRHGGMSRIDIVGGTGPDFSAVVTGHISQAEGSFDSVTGVTSTNAYSLQINTAPFSTTTCNGSQPVPDGPCNGWQQFVYESSGSSFIQYWLLRYGPAGTMCPMPRHANCPVPLNSVFSDGWCPFQFTATGPVYCVINAVNQPTVPPVPMTSLGQLKITGAAASGAANDAITLTVGGTPPSTATGDNRFPDLGNQWQEVEFNVFGNGGGSQASFNAGSTVVVRTAVTSGTATGPGCHVIAPSFTGESNNLTLVNSPPTASSGTAPALVFSQSNPASAGAAATCADAASVGDTHLTTFDGLLYDFQATGDFLLAEDGSDFVVHSRQVPSPGNPNVSINRAVATQMGNTRVAICLQTPPLEVDGQPRDLADGKWLSLPEGVIVSRRGNVYLIMNQSGDSVRASLNNGWIDVSVGLGHAPHNARGLLANPEHDVHLIQTRGGRVLDYSRVTFSELYGEYGGSWRVPSEQSLLCGEKTIEGNPAKPDYANEDPQFKLGREICKAAGVNERLLESCTLDVTVLNHTGAAEVFRHARAPVAELRPRYP